ncbi:MAG TPA: HTH domain-containing protein, partial [Steroidobacteraceae bacterium]|nr:HTH domain-containing protein [Steroidobacteraceae bacterium]
MTAEEIVESARKLNILDSAGKTPTNTMRARLSDDIRLLGGQSSFQRVGPNRFGLREWGVGDYVWRPFQKSLPNETTVCVSGTIQQQLGFGGVGYSALPATLTAYLGIPRNLHFIDRPTAETTTKYKQLIAYAWLETADGLVLSYTRGKYSSAHRTLLLGRKSVGFGGHVLKQDAETLFGASDGGTQQAAIREIYEELSPKISLQVRPAGVIWDDSSLEGQKHIGLVMHASLPHSSQIELKSGELSIKQVQLLRKEQLWEAYHAMEFWSQLLIREFAADAKPSVVSTIVPAVRPRKMRHMVLVGEIANGKSSIAAALA